MKIVEKIINLGFKVLIAATFDHDFFLLKIIEIINSSVKEAILDMKTKSAKIKSY